MEGEYSSTQENWVKLTFTVTNNNPFPVRVTVTGEIRFLDGDVIPQSETKRMTPYEEWSGTMFWDDFEGSPGEWDFDITEVTRV
jgi:hypothetical protein